MVRIASSSRHIHSSSLCCFLNTRRRAGRNGRNARASDAARSTLGTERRSGADIAEAAVVQTGTRTPSRYRRCESLETWTPLDRHSGPNGTWDRMALGTERRSGLIDTRARSEHSRMLPVLRGSNGSPRPRERGDRGVVEAVSLDSYRPARKRARGTDSRPAACQQRAPNPGSNPAAEVFTSHGRVSRCRRVQLSGTRVPRPSSALAARSTTRSAPAPPRRRWIPSPSFLD
jgi:hypothetical protein